MKPYSSPRIEVLGSVRDFTLYKNKIGPNPDATSSVNGISGSIVTIP